MGAAHADGSEAARVLRVPRGDDGALGRPGGDRVHRRPPDRRHARPQRAAPGALLRDRRRHGDHGVGGRRAADPREQDRQEVAAAAGQDVPDRPRAGPHHRRQGTEGSAGQQQALPRVDRGDPHQARRDRRRRQATCRRTSPRPGRPPPARPPAGVRLHAGGPEVPDGADGRSRRGGDRLDGQRLAARGAVGQEQAAVQLLQAAVRAGHQPADRSDPRAAGDVAGVVHRSEAEPARPEQHQPADAARGLAAGARLRRHGADPPHRALHRQQVQVLGTGHLLSGRLGQGRHRGAAGVARRRGRGRRALGLQHPDRVRPQGRPRAASRSRRCWRPARSTSTWSTRGCAPAPAWSSRPARRARCTTSRCSPATAPRRSIRTSRWRRWPSMHRDMPGEIGAREGDQELHQGDRQGAEEGDVQDGHLHLHELHRRADLRGDRPVARAGRQVLHRHRAATSRASSCSRSPRRRIRLHRGAFGNDPVLAGMLDAGGEYAYRIRGEDHMWTPDVDRQAAARHAPEQLRRPTRSTRS